MSFLVLFLSSRCAQPHTFTPGSGPSREPGCAPASHARTFAITRAGVTHKSCVSPLIPYSLTFTVPVPPLPGCSSNTDAAIRLSPLISGYSGNGSCALSLASATQPCRSRAGFVHNWNVFQAYQSETEVSTGRKGVTLSGEGT